MFNKLFAVCLLVEDFSQSFNFYKNILGLKLNTQEKDFANFRLGETELAIFERKSATTMFSRKYMGKGGGVIIGFQVEDIRMSCKSLKSKGVNIFEGPKQTPWNQEVAYFYDPDKNIWEISEYFEEK